MKINRDGIQDYQVDTNIERVCDHCSGDMLGFEGGYLDIGKKKRVSLGGPAYDHKKQDARFKVHVGLFPDGVDASESFDICGRCIRKALYDASEYLGKKAKVEDRVPGTPMPRQTKDGHAVAAAAPESPGGCRIRPVLVWLPNDDLDTASTTAEKYGEVIEERDSLKRQLEEVTAQKEEWRKLFGDQALDFFDLRGKISQAESEFGDGASLHAAFRHCGLTELAEMARLELERIEVDHKHSLEKCGQRAVDELDERYIQDVAYFAEFHAAVDRVKRLVDAHECSLFTALESEGLDVLATLAEEQLNEYYCKLGDKEDMMRREYRKVDEERRALKTRVKWLEEKMEKMVPMAELVAEENIADGLKEDVTRLNRKLDIAIAAFEILYRHVPTVESKAFYLKKAKEQVDDEPIPF